MSTGSSDVDWRLSISRVWHRYRGMYHISIGRVLAVYWLDIGRTARCEAAGVFAIA